MSVCNLLYYVQMHASPMITRGRVTSHDPASAGDPKNFHTSLQSDAGLHLNPKKCDFHQTETTDLGLIIGRSGVRMQPEKVQAIQDWKTPSNLTNVRSFLGFANCYRRFIHGFSSTVRPLTELTRKDRCFHWDKE